ncbi:MAG: indole-3-glycerol phosphate synthase TrpC [Kofleriaceae bacterium]
MSAPLPDVLARILDTKRREIDAAEAAVPRRELEARLVELPEIRSLTQALVRPPGAPVRVLAEIKRASPSAGPIRPGADPVEIARDYVAHGAAALSVLTDRDYFDGDLGFLAPVRAAVDVPLLRKDFIIDPYQVIEARLAGADAILLIAMALDDDDLRALLGLAADVGLEALVEVHDAGEATRAVRAGASLIGINHRDLRTFTVDTGLTAAIAPGCRRPPWWWPRAASAPPPTSWRWAPPARTRCSSARR